MSFHVAVVRHELPIGEHRFSIQAHGFRPLCLQMEDDVPVLYEIGIIAEEEPEGYTHHFVWIQTGSHLPEGLRQDSY